MDGRMRLGGTLARLGSFRSPNATRGRLQPLTEKQAERGGRFRPHQDDAWGSGRRSVQLVPHPAGTQAHVPRAAAHVILTG